MLVCGSARAQGNYEIQVYGADTVAPKDLMVELHSNFTVVGADAGDRWRAADEPPGARDAGADGGDQ